MLRAGLVGFPSTGKSTLLHLLAGQLGDATRAVGKQDSQVGMVQVPDSRLDRLTALFEPRRQVPATVAVTELAGHGSATAMLDVSGFRNADALLHVLRMFSDDRVPHVAGHVDPRRDTQQMEEELILADLAVAERRLDKLSQDLKRRRSSELEAEARILQHCQSTLEEGRPLRSLTFDSDDTKRLRGFSFLSAKPLLIVLNLDEVDVSDPQKAIDRSGLEKVISGTSIETVAVCAKIELEIAQLVESDREIFLADIGLADSGLDRVVRACYGLLGYISFFTVGKDECRAWSVPIGTSAQGAAGEIHSDISRGFIRAEVVPYEALEARNGSQAACRENGEVRLEGKEYEIRDGDVINFRFAT